MENPASTAKSQFDYLKIAIEDVVRFQAQQVDLLHRSDAKAMQLMALYVAITGAIGAQTITLHFAKGGPAGAIDFFFGTAITLLVGSFLALRALWTVPIYLPGRKPDFWAWAIDNAIPSEQALKEYLAQAPEYIVHNDKANQRASKLLRWAYSCGPLSVIVGGLCLALRPTSLLNL